jgi:hypothetical protein
MAPWSQRSWLRSSSSRAVMERSARTQYRIWAFLEPRPPAPAPA